jgi:hypothetical protein
MKHLSAENHQELLAQARTLSRDGRGDKVLALPDGRMVKVFRRRHFITSDLIRPYALRFRENAQALALLGVRTVAVEEVFSCPSQHQHLVLYRSVPGRTLREALANGSGKDDLLPRFAIFFAHLHGKGVLFRSVHFGNVILCPEDGQFALIDVADMTLHKGALNLSQRVRNFRHMIRYEVDRNRIAAGGAEAFLRQYLDSSLLSADKKENLCRKLAREVPFFRFSDPV